MTTARNLIGREPRPRMGRSDRPSARMASSSRTGRTQRRAATAPTTATRPDARPRPSKAPRQVATTVRLRHSAKMQTRRLQIGPKWGSCSLQPTSGPICKFRNTNSRTPREIRPRPAKSSARVDSAKSTCAKLFKAVAARR